MDVFAVFNGLDDSSCHLHSHGLPLSLQLQLAHLIIKTSKFGMSGKLAVAFGELIQSIDSNGGRSGLGKGAMGLLFGGGGGGGGGGAYGGAIPPRNFKHTIGRYVS